MKRLLIPLLAALSLPTAISAEGYGNNESMINRFCSSIERRGIDTYRDCLTENNPQNMSNLLINGKHISQVELI